MTQIHPSAIVDSQAELAEDVVVGPFCLVGPKVCIGVGTVLRSHVVVEGSTTIGARNVIYAGEYWLPSAGQKVPRRGYASGGG